MNELTNNLRVLRPLWRGLPLILLCMGLAMLAAVQYLRYTTPVYESTAKIRLAEANESAVNSNLVKTTDAFSPNNKTGAEVELLKSRMLVSKALDRLAFDVSTYRVGEIRKTEMYRESPFSVNLQLYNALWQDEPFQLEIQSADRFALTTPGGETLNGRFGQRLHCAGADIVIGKNQQLLSAKPGLELQDNYEFVQHSRAQLMQDVLERLDITSVDKDVAVIRVSFRSAVPEKAADLVNALTATYMADYLENKYKVANTTVDFIDRQLQSVGANLARSENSIEGYRDQKRIVNIGQETDTELHKIAEMKLQRANLNMSLAAANDLYRYMRSGEKNVLELAPTFEAFNDLLSNDIVKKMKDLQADRRDLLLRFKPEDEKVVAIDQKMADLNSYLLESIKNTRNALTIRYREIDQTIRQSEQVFVGLPTREKNMAILERNFQLNEKLYTMLHEKKTEAEIAKATPTSSHRIISEGVPANDPVSPNRTLIVLVSGFLGMVVGIGLVYLLAAIRATPTNTMHVQRESRIPLAASIPFLPAAAQRAAYFRQLTTRLELKGLLSLGQKLVVTSFTEEEGQRFVFENLSAALQSQGKKVRGLRIADPQSPDPAAMPTELLLVHNLPLDDDSHSLAVMAGADVNLVLIDSCATPLHRLHELELLVDEYKLPNVYFCLNREGYEPGLWHLLRKRQVRQASWKFADAPRPAGAPATA
ncbi:GumC family protein [Hymenobacter yonginensis]|uniref:Wzz/FepE/Etk N-terminal domain-containing protein n=1 Tax=Hymenobacter yonginensis TaxID=748197 RepID=A0ABY7PRD3_9BACT|nr:GNVR domain-containing protein [Hymenobacter yonginensis]WBO85414.1 Wzz/FepE/Etk N-terminal domain-containing protein [Hymenobacter yonginensis]